MNEKVRVNVYLDKETHKKFKIQCLNNDTTISKEFNKYMYEQLEKKENKNV